MRWEQLFADLEAQLDAAEREDRDAELRDRMRAEQARLRLTDRLAGGGTRDLQVGLAGGRTFRGQLLRAGADWVLLGGEPGEVLVPLAAVAVVRGLSGRSGDRGIVGGIDSRLDLRYVLRATSRDRRRVTVGLRDQQVSGVIARVGADFVEVADASGTVAEAGATLIALRHVLFVQSR